MKHMLCCLFAFAFATGVSAQENPFKKSSSGDWVKYLVTTKNETVPAMSTKDQPRWKAITNKTDEFVRIDNYIMFGERRSGAGADLSYLKDPYEPVAGVAKSTKIQVVSTSKEKLTINGKQYECVKRVRKINQPVDESQLISSWIGTSTLWLCDDIPFGLAKMENAYQLKLTKDDQGQKLVESWTVAEFGFKNWTGD
jgi:hypothetical protein